MKIHKYDRDRDEDKLMQMIAAEGEEWLCYTAPENAGRYRTALAQSVTYVAYEGEVLCGYSRSLDDCGFYIYVCDLLVMPAHRGKHIGRRLTQCLYDEFPDHIVYVMSDVDEYYQKQGYMREGTVFEVTNPNQ